MRRLSLDLMHQWTTGLFVEPESQYTPTLQVRTLPRVPKVHHLHHFHSRGQRLVRVPTSPRAQRLAMR